VKASDYIVSYLKAQGVTHAFEVIGGMIAHIIDSFARTDGIQTVSMHHEQGAAFAAEGYARMSGVPGVAMATSGPGATNLLTGVGSCYFDSYPAVFLTGQVNRSEQKGGRAIRQLGFQETDIVPMAAPITKWAHKVESVEELPAVLEQAFEIALSGRPGPVLLDIPMDVQRLPVEGQAPSPVRVDQEDRRGRLSLHWNDAKRPLILAGGGIRSARAGDAFRRFVDATGIPVVHSLMAVDVLPWGHPQRVGLIGSYGNRWANLAIAQADLLIVLGSRLDIRQTGADVASFKGERRVIHVDCDPGEVNNRVTGCETVYGHLRGVLAEAAAEAEHRDYSEWLGEIAKLREQWPDTAEITGVPGINPNAFMHALTGGAPEEVAAFVVDVGQHQMWAAQSAELRAHQRFLTSGGMGAMGFALPAAIGASFASPGKPVVVIAGDGGFQLNIQELQTVVRNKLPLKIVIIDNHTHGMVRQFQESYFDGRYQSTYWGYSAPDFTKVAAAYGIASNAVSEPEKVGDALAWLWRNPLEPALLQVAVDTFANAYPKIAFGKPMTEMEPLAKPVDMEGT
jgi:acetolactate synthase I/II/III large subunit